MTVRNLAYLTKPSSVALIGASAKPSTVGEVITRNLVDSGFAGEVYPVNPHYPEIAGLRCYPDVASLPKAPELALIATPRESVPGLIDELGRKGTKVAVVISAGFGEGGDEKGKRLCTMMLDAAKPYLLRVVGPNCLGVMVPGSSLNASMAHIARPLPGAVALVAQSGAVQTAVLDWAVSRGIGFSCFISLGDMADVDFGDMLDYLAGDFRTRAILLYMETVTHCRKFMSAARAAARVKPVIVVKAGRFPEGAMAAARHTGAVAGNDAVCDAAFRRAGMLRVYDMQALFDAVETLAMMPRPISGDRLAILTNGGGVGVIATDALIDRGGRLAELSPESMQRLDAVLPPAWSRGNPVDIMSDASAERYAKALEVILDDRRVDAVLTLSCPVAVISGTEAADAVVRTYKQRLKQPKAPILLTSWLGEQTAAEARRLFSEQRVPSYKTPTDAIRAFMHLVRYQKNQQMLMETPPSIPESFSPDVEAALRIVEEALADGRQWLSAAETGSLLAAYGIPVAASLTTATREEVTRAGINPNEVVATRVLAPEILQPDEYHDTAPRLHTTPGTSPEAGGPPAGDGVATRRATGFQDLSIQRATFRPSPPHELMIKVVDDEQFGPVIRFGHGGQYADEIQDTAVALPPLNLHLAREVMSRTRVYKLLKGNRDLPPADLERIALSLVQISQMVCDLAEIAEIEINPLLADASGVVVVSARVRVVKSAIPAAERLAIRPYPKELEETVTLADGRVLQMRPIRPEDEPGFLTIFDSLTPEDRRLRFLHPIQELPHHEAARLTQIDYDREMALVLAAKDRSENGGQVLYGSVRIIADPDNERAEYAILVHREVAGKGLGKLLMRRIIDYARSRGIKEIFGQVLGENIPMLKVCAALGFTSKRSPEEPSVVIVSLRL
jgi:acetyltransferase